MVSISPQDLYLLITKLYHTYSTMYVFIIYLVIFNGWNILHFLVVIGIWVCEFCISVFTLGNCIHWYIYIWLNPWYMILYFLSRLYDLLLGLHQLIIQVWIFCTMSLMMKLFIIMSYLAAVRLFVLKTWKLFCTSTLWSLEYYDSSSSTGAMQ